IICLITLTWSVPGKWHRLILFFIFNLCYEQLVIVFYNHEMLLLFGTLNLDFFCFIGVFDAIFFWINPSLTGTSPVQQSDCFEQSRSAATKDIVFLCV
ncbi:hypothetical protein, partial [Klebsiella pneumoniae]|uniref:hypothetical protein n=1 Tax=Klebsiella pneumoniae TaxID=573 RepID=UPI0023809C40